MSMLTDGFERALEALVRRASARITVFAALLVYAVLGLALPLVLHWRPWALVLANLLGTAYCAGILLTCLGIQLERRDRRHLLEWTTNLRLLTAEEFEWLVGEMFRREGWAVRETGRHDGPDGNIDVELTRAGTRRIVQCKRWQSWLVGVNEIREFAGSPMREGLAGRDGIFITLSGFTPDAEAEAKRIGIEIVDNARLVPRLEAVRKVEPCPRCGESMLLGRSAHGWWFRCVATGCSGKRDLGNEPGRAVEFLTGVAEIPKQAPPTVSGASTGWFRGL
jgi:hypothetical protein